ncbi:MAG: hypothetical protein MRY21_04000 [Simkaniaceae bacterium]|nr:hypothetical protein [Simkaniaceae bacterium]
MATSVELKPWDTTRCEEVGCGETAVKDVLCNCGMRLCKSHMLAGTAAHTCDKTAGYAHRLIKGPEDPFAT